MKKISSESIRFLQKHISKKKLLPLMPLDENSVYDLMELIESEIEVPLAQSEDAGEPVDEKTLAESVRVIDELNEEPDAIDYEDLNQKLKE